MTPDPSPHLPPRSRLLTWLSPAFPVGGFSYSHGIEWAVEVGAIRDAATLEAWLRDLLRHGGPWQDAVLFCRVWQALDANDMPGFTETAELAAALTPSAERRLETTAQGRAFTDMVGAVWPEMLDGLPDIAMTYPVAVAAASHRLELPLTDALSAFLTAVTANLVSAAVRLIPLGQTDGLKVVAALEPRVAATARLAAEAGEHDIGGLSVLADIASMKHETQHTRLFRS